MEIEDNKLVISEKEKEIIDNIIVPTIMQQIKDESNIKKEEDETGWDDEDSFEEPNLESEYDHKGWLGIHEKRKTYSRPIHFLAKDFKFGNLKDEKQAFLYSMYWECAEEYASLGYNEVGERALCQLLAKNDALVSVNHVGLDSQTGNMGRQRFMESGPFVTDETANEEMQNNNGNPKKSIWDRLERFRK
jgi:hypothetical protein